MNPTMHPCPLPTLRMVPPPHCTQIHFTLFTDLNWHIVTSAKSITPPKSDLLVKVEHKVLNMLLMFSGSSQVSVHIRDGGKAFLDFTILRLVVILFLFFGMCTPAHISFVTPCMTLVIHKIFAQNIEINRVGG